MRSLLASFIHLVWPLFLVACNDVVNEPRRASDDVVGKPRNVAKDAVPKPRRLPYSLVSTHPHDTTASTQGLLLHEGVYYESTGGYGTSTLRQVDPRSGRVLKRTTLPYHAFGEGLALREGKLYQLEWMSGKGLIYDQGTFELVGNFRYAGQGWGLAWDGEHFILSDGSSYLRFLEPDSFALARSVKVGNHLGPVDRLNELEYIDGKVFANPWFRDEILVIDPATGLVEATLDLSALERPRPRNPEAVLNGIAHDPDTHLLRVTGKSWPRLYVLRIQN